MIPKRKKNRTRKITINYLRQKNNDTKWAIARRPGVVQKRKMLALAVSVGVQCVMSSHTYMVGDTAYLQTEGGAIGLELTGAVSRPFMQKWDRNYLKLIKAAGIDMNVYERYVDDSNQVAKVPPNGYSFDVVTGKLKFDLDDMRQNEQEDARLARILQQVANNVQTGIEMESDYPSKNRSQKLAILDMEVWIDPENRILYQHYEKQVASKNVLNAKSAQSSKCKRNVHVQEVVRRLVNTSTRIEWENITPVLSNYMKRMQIGGYYEGYRKTTLKHALEIYDRKLLSHETGQQPLNRPRCWQEGERRREKRKRRNNWSAKGGCIPPYLYLQPLVVSLQMS